MGCFLLFAPETSKKKLFKKLKYYIRNNSLSYSIAFLCFGIATLIGIDWLFGFERGTKPSLDFLTAFGTVGATLIAAYSIYQNYQIRKNALSYEFAEKLCNKANEITEIFREKSLSDLGLGNEEHNLFMNQTSIFIGSYLMGSNLQRSYEDTKTWIKDSHKHNDSKRQNKEEKLKSFTINFIQTIQEIKKYDADSYMEDHFFNRKLETLVSYLFEPYNDIEILEILKDSIHMSKPQEVGYLIETIRNIRKERENETQKVDFNQFVYLFLFFIKALKPLEDICIEMRMKYKSHIDIEELFSYNNDKENLSYLLAMLKLMLEGDFSSESSKEHMNEEYKNFIYICRNSNLPIRSLRQEEPQVFSMED